MERGDPQAGVFNPNDAAESIDSDIVQRLVIDKILGMPDGRDKRINYVGGNKDAAYLVKCVDEGQYDLAISLAPVTMDQFCAVCEQNKFMPPKSTWFDPKIRSGWSWPNWTESVATFARTWAISRRFPTFWRTWLRG